MIKTPCLFTAFRHLNGFADWLLQSEKTVRDVLIQESLQWTYRNVKYWIGGRHYKCLLLLVSFHSYLNVMLKWVVFMNDINKEMKWNADINQTGLLKKMVWIQTRGTIKHLASWDISLCLFMDQQLLCFFPPLTPLRKRDIWGFHFPAEFPPFSSDSWSQHCCWMKDITLKKQQLLVLLKKTSDGFRVHSHSRVGSASQAEQRKMNGLRGAETQQERSALRVGSLPLGMVMTLRWRYSVL